MIKFSNQVPSIYPNASRDFQYICWLADIVLNSVKHNVDDLYLLPNVSNNIKLTELLAMTLGFKVKRNYDEKQLAALVCVLPNILKYKGTEKAIEMAADVLIKSAGAIGSFSCEVNGAQLEIGLPEDLLDINLFVDLLEYILPAGMTYRINRKIQIKKDLGDILLGFNDKVIYGAYKDFDLDISDINAQSGLSSLYFVPDPGDRKDHEFAANFVQDDIGNIDVNEGLLNNTVIPILSTRTPSDYQDERYFNMITSDELLLSGSDDKILLGRED